MASRRESTGRYEVNDKLCESIAMAVGYGMHVVGRDGVPDTIYVREVGQPGSLRIIERHQDGSATVRPTNPPTRGET